jgi:hypothetical protein
MARVFEEFQAGAQERMGPFPSLPVVAMNRAGHLGQGQYGGQDEEIEVIDLDSNRTTNLKPHTWGRA